MAASSGLRDLECKWWKTKRLDQNKKSCNDEKGDDAVGQCVCVCVCVCVKRMKRKAINERNGKS